MLEEARALKELYEAGYYDEEEYKAEQVALKKKYGRAAPLKSNKSKTKKQGNFFQQARAELFNAKNKGTELHLNNTPHCNLGGLLVNKKGKGK